MEAVSYINDKDIYVVAPIMDTVDIPTHVQKVLEIGTPIDDIENYIGSMRDSKYAIKVMKNGICTGWFYGDVKDGRYYGRSIYAEDIYSGILLFKHIFELYPSHKIQFMPHDVKSMLWFKSMLSVESIKLWYSAKRPVAVLKSTIVVKGIKIFKYLGFEE